MKTAILASPTVSVKPVEVPAPGRPSPLQVRISAPLQGQDLPIVLFAHGFGSSLHGYGPLTEYWAASGFVVVQATHLDSRTLGVAPDDPRIRTIWRSRVDDLKFILDELPLIEATVPGLAGRVDHSRIAATGHSFGGQSAGNLLGLRVLDPETGSGEDLSDSRVKAGLLLATAGQGGADLTPFAVQHFPFLNPDFSGMATPTLIVAGDRDDSPLSVRGPDWMTDPYTFSPGPKSLLTLLGAEHSLGGIPGYEAAETTDENPERLALLQRLSTAYLKTTLGVDEQAWPRAVAELGADDPRARIESKG